MKARAPLAGLGVVIALALSGCSSTPAQAAEVCVDPVTNLRVDDSQCERPLIPGAFIWWYIGSGYTVPAYGSFHEGDRWGDQETRRKDGVQRTNVHTAIWGMVLFWPIHSWVFAINYELNQELDRADPHLQQRRIEEQDRRIAELERELKIQ